MITADGALGKPRSNRVTLVSKSVEAIRTIISAYVRDGAR